MLQQVCEHIHNYFIREAHVGRWIIADGMIAPDFLKDGQRFWIVGSDLNDGVYTYHDGWIGNDDDTAVAGLSDEDFNGTVCALAVPPAVIALSGEITSWVEKYGDIANSPYQSESFNGYSYTKKNANDAAGGPTWASAFADRLNRFRKVTL